MRWGAARLRTSDPAQNKTRHIKGIGNAYLINFADKRVYLSGDGEIIPEMSDFNNVALSFMGYSQPFNMTKAMFTEAAKVIGAPVMVPYHYDNNDIIDLTEAFQLLTEFTLLTQAMETSGLKPIPDKLYLYPNPAKDRLYSRAFKPNATFSVYNSMGIKVVSEKLNSDGFISVSQLPSGIYLLSIQGQVGTFLVE